MAAAQPYPAILLLLCFICTSRLQVVAGESIPHLKLDSKILQESIIDLINGNPRAGWRAEMSPRFTNYTVGQFKHLLGAKPTSHHDLTDIPVNTHRKTPKLPDQYDARTTWPQCSTIGRILDQCDPYFDNTGCSHPGCEPRYSTPECHEKCVNENLLWRNSKHFSASAYTISSDPSNIMAEVYQNGPVVVGFTVYEDFAHYKSGLYKHVIGGALGGHAVKLIGWGTTEEGEDYWLLANQWSRSWGDDGYFKIKRGTNECGIENSVVAGLPSSKNLIKQVTDIEASDS